MKKLTKLDETIIVVVTIALKSSSDRNLEVTTHINDISTILILPKALRQRQKVKHKFPSTLSLPINYFVILILIIGKN